MTVATWTRVCALDALTVERGVAALVDEQPVAVFRLAGDEVVAVGNIDPFSRASVLSRGIVGSKGDVVTVASPVYKQRFDLRTGRCIDDETVSIPVYAVRVVDGWIELAR
jgi:nitrite reductase (NADH) small subunit